jgi:hypothetical protein
MFTMAKAVCHFTSFSKTMVENRPGIWSAAASLCSGETSVSPSDKKRVWYNKKLDNNTHNWLLRYAGNCPLQEYIACGKFYLPGK